MTGPDLPDTRNPVPSDAGVTDDALAARIRAAAGADQTVVDATAELHELAPRFRRARRRRQAVVATMSSAAAVIVIVGAFALDRGDRTRVDTIDVGGSPTTTVVDDPTPDTTTTTAPTTTTVPTTVTTVATTSTTIPAGSGDPGAGALVPGPSTPPGTVATTPTTTTTTVPVGDTRTLSATGGTTTIRWDATSISVLSTAPASGWVVDEIDQRTATRVVVTFRRDDGGPGSSNSTIDARVVDGRLDVNV